MSTFKTRLLALLLLLSGPVLALQGVTISNVNLRAGPSSTARVLKVIPKATTLAVEVCTTWCSVSYGSQPGFVARSTLSFKQGAPPKMPTNLPVNSGTYTNVDGQQIRRPVMSNAAPAGASAKCRDGSYSFSAHRRGTCSHHGGVGQWL
ncbi:DUF3761 domain-containing protein [Deinococcus radiomollis]|uniref:DUF3761 domain-containing protein n=1 Tax=Deinococcus radiomollis TaxID=468916 RepID=UPI0038913543